MKTTSGTKSLRAMKLVGIAADHGGFKLKAFLVGKLRAAGYAVTDFGDEQLKPADDYPDFIIPLARAVAAGTVERGVGICASGIGAAMAANKVAGVRAGLVENRFSAQQGVEDDDLNMICLGGCLVGQVQAWGLVQTFLAARYGGEERFRRRLEKVAELENLSPTPANGAARPTKAADIYCAPKEPHLMTVQEAVTAWRNEGDPN